ncbi:unnamed protein product [Danaus chrysippus]|uniref:(African queen) hypothetical protein n=1 Tax=Danaus chrysippus TaxID=151541 RepID=A0A8J2QL15_9NEOP|nr:unnamed protein product [Danaus chrysippus]
MQRRGHRGNYPGRVTGYPGNSSLSRLTLHDTSNLLSDSDGIGWIYLEGFEIITGLDVRSLMCVNIKGVVLF